MSFFRYLLCFAFAIFYANTNCALAKIDPSNDRKSALIAVSNAMKLECSAFNVEIEKIDSPSIKDAAIWYSGTIVKNCVKLNDLFNIFYYRKELGEINNEMVGNLTSLVLQSVVVAKQNESSFTNEDKNLIFSLMEDILELEDELTSPKAVEQALLTMKEIGVSKAIISKYANISWGKKTFTADEWTSFFGEFSTFLNEEAHFANLQNMLLNGEVNIVAESLPYIRNPQKVSFLKNAINVFNLQTQNAIQMELNVECANNWLALIVALKKTNILSIEERLNIINHISAINLEIPSFGYKSFMATIRGNMETINQSVAKSVYNAVSKIKGLNGNNYFEQQFFLGWLDLEMNQMTESAIARFKNAAKFSSTPKQKAQIFYWLGRAASKSSNEKTKLRATRFYEISGKYPFLFYGQLSLEELSKNPARISYLALKESNVTTCEPFSTDIFLELGYIFYKSSLIWVGQRYVDEGIKNASTKGVGSCYLKTVLEIFDNKFSAYFGRLAASFNIPLKEASFPFSKYSKSSLVNAIIRIESLFGSGASISPSGAIGLMQIMEPSAREVAKKLGLGELDKVRLIEDGLYNTTIGSAFLQSMLETHETIPTAVAAYNAGSSKVKGWVNAIGNPGVDKYKMINWIESIPYKETRDYVKGVMEAKVVYDGLLTYGSL